MTERKTVAVVGGGLAGLAAGCALADAGFEVTVYERRPFLGGRASSYEHPGTGEIVDNCQHVLLGCCTNLLDLYRRIGVEHQIRWYDALTFIEPGGRQSQIAISGLPAPMHTAPSFLRAAALSLKDKLAITRAMLALMPASLLDTGGNFLQWLKRHGQTERAIERFWKVVLVSALNEDLDRMSVSSAALVFRESFLKSPQAGRMGVPSVPLTDLYSKAGDYITARSGRIAFRSNVESMQASIFRKYVGETGRPLLSPSADQSVVAPPSLAAESGIVDPAVKLCLNGGEVLPDYAVLAVPFDVLRRILPDNSPARPLREHLAHFGTSPITGVHLWFDREIADLDHAVLLDRTIQWMFHKSRIQNREVTPVPPSAGPGFVAPPSSSADPINNPSLPARNSQLATRNSGSYIELVISASKSLIDKSRTEIIDLAVHELADFFPAVREAKLLKATVIKEVHATYSPVPGIDQFRPHPQTPWPQVFLAGDWTATGWPATMEGAVRSGYLAAEALCNGVGTTVHFLAPDLPATGLMRLFR